jgi:hypothetical protein
VRSRANTRSGEKADPLCALPASLASVDLLPHFALRGIVAKLADAPYRETRPPDWIKIKNPTYSQAEGRHEFFEPTRNRR